MKHKGGIPFEYNQITKYIYVGTNACCKIHFSQELLNKSIKADISLDDESIDQPWGVKYFLWLPTKNDTPPTKEQLNIGASILKSLIKNKIKTYIHCKRGHGRAPTLVAAYLISQGKSVEQAIKILKSKRPSIHLEKSQIQALNRF